jgi:L-ribulose-5-phosphate 4-epimerase
LGCPAALVAGHAPFCWGASPAEATHIAVILEELAAMALETLSVNPKAGPLPAALHKKHHTRKHGPAAYYGQKTAR